MKSKKITSIKQARRVIEQSGILEINEDDGTADANLITWWDGYYVNELGYLYKGRKSRKVYTVVDPKPSELRAIAKVFNYEVVCSLYGNSHTLRDYHILWLKESVNECTS